VVGAQPVSWTEVDAIVRARAVIARKIESQCPGWSVWHDDVWGWHAVRKRDGFRLAKVSGSPSLISQIRCAGS
jgi:hypothetical protein